MRINAKCQIERVMSTDAARQALCAAWYDVDGKRLVACDGHALAVVPATPDDGDHSGYVTVDAIKAARKAAGKRGEPTVLLNGSQIVPNGPTFERPTVESVGEYPPVDQVIPSYDDAETFTVGLDPALLLDLAKAIGSPDALRLTFKVRDADGKIVKGSLDPIRVETAEGFGVLMPCRI